MEESDGFKIKDDDDDKLRLFTFKSKIQTFLFNFLIGETVVFRSVEYLNIFNYFFITLACVRNKTWYTSGIRKSMWWDDDSE